MAPLTIIINTIYDCREVDLNVLEGRTLRRK